MDTTTPIIKGLEAYEAHPTGSQDEIFPALRAIDGRVITRWTLTDEERQSVAEGADIYLTVATMNQTFQPVKLDVGDPLPGMSVEGIKHDLRLDEQAELMALMRESNAKAIEAKNARLKFEERRNHIFAPEEKSSLVLAN